MELPRNADRVAVRTFNVGGFQPTMTSDSVLFGPRHSNYRTLSNQEIRERIEEMKCFTFVGVTEHANTDAMCPSFAVATERMLSRPSGADDSCDEPGRRI